MKTILTLSALLSISALMACAQDSGGRMDSVRLIAAAADFETAAGDTTRPPADFVDVDQEPEVILKVEPVYPALAVKAGIEGKVWVKIWVGKSGVPHDVVLIKSEQEVLNASAIEAAKQFRFKPATIKGKPVDVWVAVPFKFKLAEKKTPQFSPGDTTYGNIPSVLQDFVRDVLEGPVPDVGRTTELLSSRAQSIAGGYLRPLALAIGDQREGKHPIEQPGRKVAFFTYGMADDGRSGYVVARTEKTGKGSTPHYHTIVIQEDAQGHWKIAHWHTWHSSR